MSILSIALRFIVPALLIASFNLNAMSGAVFTKIEKGHFSMGSPFNEMMRGHDENAQDVEITRSFEVMITEVTQMQWFMVTGSNPSRFSKVRDCKNNYRNINGHGLCPNNPVEKVSWDDVQEFIKLLNKSKRLTGCKGLPSDPRGCYRLPTEAEWEYFARGKTSTMFSFGNNFYELGYHAWFSRNGDERTHPVGLLKANPYGLYDIHGNVWEWVQDRYETYLSGGVDPVNLEYGSNRTIRGGGYDNRLQYMRTANREPSYPDFSMSSVGFRLVRNL